MHLLLVNLHSSMLLLRVLALLVVVLFFSSCHASDRTDGRYSFSLTTFDPSGKLGQVERASQAAAKGTPVLALIRPSAILFASPQALPSPLIEDDGTSRFARVTSEIVVSHSGLSADGRVLVAAAQRMAVEHEYTFDEEIRVEIFLEELSLLFQEYTMKAAARPFGATLVVAYLPKQRFLTDKHARPQLYRIDPSGSVLALGDHAIVNDSFGRTELEARLGDMAASPVTSSVEEDELSLVKLLKQALKEQVTKKNEKDFPDLAVLTAPSETSD
jgi:20S proteasome subunit alpha 2